MAGLEYTEAVLDDIAASLRRVLPSYGLPPDAPLALLNVSENATFLVGAGDRKSICRVHRVGYHTRSRIASELAWIDALRQDRIAETAEPLADRQGERIQTLRSARGLPDRFAVMFSFLEGQEPSPEDDLPPWFERLGALTARLHVHARSWPKPAGFTRHVWDTEAMHGARPLWGPWQAGLGLDGPGAALLRRAVEEIARRTHHYGTGPDRFGLIHADLRLANLLVDDTTLKVIDFDDMGFSWNLYDFASAISFYEHLPNVPALRDAWLAGYETVLPLSAEDRAMVPSFVMARRILLVAWIASHAEVPIAIELGAGYTADTLRLAEAYLSGAFLA
jgi:Ser/Thr protein kinase RdoA (MazF antagonist)